MFYCFFSWRFDTIAPYVQGQMHLGSRVYICTPKCFGRNFLYMIYTRCMYKKWCGLCNKHHVVSYKLASNLRSNNHKHLDSLKTNYHRCFFTVSYLALTPYYYYQPYMNYGFHDALFLAMTYFMIV